MTKSKIHPVVMAHMIRVAKQFKGRIKRRDLEADNRRYLNALYNIRLIASGKIEVFEGTNAAILKIVSKVMDKER